MGATLISAGVGALGNVSGQIEEGKSFETLDWLSVADSALLSGALGYLAGAGASNSAALQKAGVSIVSPLMVKSPL